VLPNIFGSTRSQKYLEARAPNYFWEREEKYFPSRFRKYFCSRSRKIFLFSRPKRFLFFARNGRVLARSLAFEVQNRPIFPEFISELLARILAIFR